jgi:ribose 5-phosphate isomerase A
MTQDELKSLVGKEAAKYVTNNTVIGLGSGTTVGFLVKAIAAKFKEESLDVTFVSSSEKTASLAESLGLHVVEFDDVDSIDLSFEGADEVDEDLNGIKGGGTALLREKILANNSDETILIVDESKVVKKLGKYPLPVEVNPFGLKHVIKALAKLGLNPKLRTNQSSAMVKTDSKNYVVDISLDAVKNSDKFLAKLHDIAGIVDHGLITNYCDTVLVGRQTGVKILNKSK